MIRRLVIAAVLAAGLARAQVSKLFDYAWCESGLKGTNFAHDWSGRAGMFASNGNLSATGVYTFDGTNYLYRQTNDFGFSDARGTLVALIKLVRPTSTVARIWSSGDQGSATSYATFQSSSAGGLVWNTQASASDGSLVSASGGTLASGVWATVGVTCDAISAQLYKNGAALMQTTTGVSSARWLAGVTNRDNITVANFLISSANRSPLAVAFVGYSSRAFSSNEMAAAAAQLEPLRSTLP